MIDNNQNATINDYTIPDTIEDTISQIKWMPNQNNHFLASCGWDSKVRVWQVAYQLTNNKSNPASIQSNLMFNTQRSVIFNYRSVILQSNGWVILDRSYDIALLKRPEWMNIMFKLEIKALKYIKKFISVIMLFQ